MANQAIFRHGTPIMSDYTPGSAISAGDVVVVDDVPCIAHSDLVSGRLEAVAMRGGAYECAADAAIVAGSKVYWDDTNNKVTETATGNKGFGYIEAGSSAAADGDKVNVIHAPFS